MIQLLQVLMLILTILGIGMLSVFGSIANRATKVAIFIAAICLMVATILAIVNGIIVQEITFFLLAVVEGLIVATAFYAYFQIRKVELRAKQHKRLE